MPSILTRRRSDEFPMNIMESQFVKLWLVSEAPPSAFPPWTGFLWQTPCTLSRTNTYFPFVTGRFLVVEYERSKPNPWGPYPVGFERLRLLFSETGVRRVQKIATASIAFRRHDVLSIRRTVLMGVHR
jgi:hypothetical protein